MLLPQPFLCIHCKKKFMKEKTAFSHICERKRRVLQETEKRVQAGLIVYNRFYQLTQGSKQTKLYAEFCDCSFYNAFVKFGSFINNVNPLYPDKFIDYVIKSGAKLDNWCKDALYQKYLFEMIKVEPVESAVQRTLKTMIEWGDSHDSDFSTYFSNVNHNRAVSDIVNGKITPWMILNTNSGKQMIGGMSDEQLNMITPAFDVQYWLKKFRDIPADVTLVKEICAEAGIK